jgi:hypothetical protein
VADVSDPNAIAWAGDVIAIPGASSIAVAPTGTQVFIGCADGSIAVLQPVFAPSQTTAPIGSS